MPPQAVHALRTRQSAKEARLTMQINLRPLTGPGVVLEIAGHHIVLSVAEATVLREALLDAIAASVKAEETAKNVHYRRGYEDRTDQARPAVLAESEAAQ